MRFIKILLSIALPTMAIAVAGAASAHAEGELFHCSVEPCVGTVLPDETAGTKTAHHVFIVKKTEGGIEKSGSMTCTQVTGAAESGPKTVNRLTTTNVQYDGCNILGSPMTVDMNGCDYLFTAESGQTHIKCPAGKTIQLTMGSPVTCTISTPEQTLKGMKFHNIGSEGAITTEITTESSVKNVKGTAGAGCKSFVGFEGEYTEGEYTTGNTIITGESEAGVMANIWWA